MSDSPKQCVHQSQGGQLGKGCRGSMLQWRGPPKADSARYLTPRSTDQTVSFTLLHTPNNDERRLSLSLWLTNKPTEGNAWATAEMSHLEKSQFITSNIKSKLKMRRNKELLKNLSDWKTGLLSGITSTISRIGPPMGKECEQSEQDCSNS